MTNHEIADRLQWLIDQMQSLLDKVEKQEASEPAPAAPKAEKPKTLKLEDVRAALTRLAGDKGAAAVKALLKDFGADKLSDIAAQDYPELLAKAQEMGK